MHGAEVGVSAGRAGHNGKGLVRVQRRRFLELLLNAHHGMRLFISINPSDLLPGLHRDGLRIESEILNLDPVILGACARVLRFSAVSDR